MVSIVALAVILAIQSVVDDRNAKQIEDKEIALAASAQLIMDIPQVLSGNSDTFVAALRKTYGREIQVKTIQGTDDAPVLFVGHKDLHMEVFEEGGQVETVNVFFARKQPNFRVAMKILGLSGVAKDQRAEYPAAFEWKRPMKGVASIRALRSPAGESGIEGVSIRLEE